MRWQRPRSGFETSDLLPNNTAVLTGCADVTQPLLASGLTVAATLRVLEDKIMQFLLKAELGYKYRAGLADPVEQQ